MLTGILFDEVSLTLVTCNYGCCLAPRSFTCQEERTWLHSPSGRHATPDASRVETRGKPRRPQDIVRQPGTLWRICAVKTHNPAAFILITAVPTMSTAIQAVNLGAYRYIIKTDTLVEELNLTVERALEDLALHEENLRLPLAHIPGSVTGIATSSEAIQIPPECIDFESHVSQMEKHYLQAALQTAGGVRRQAAALLKMSYQSFCHHAKKYRI